MENQECSFDPRIITNWTCQLDKITATKRAISVRVVVRPGMSLDDMKVKQNDFFPPFKSNISFSNIYYSVEINVGRQEGKSYQI